MQNLKERKKKCEKLEGGNLLRKKTGVKTRGNLLEQNLKERKQALA